MLHRRVLSFMAVALSPLVAAAPLSAQSTAPVVGRWSIEWELGRMVENDVVHPITASGTLTITESGDSLLAVVEVQKRSDNAPLPRPATLGGKRTTGGATFVQLQQVRLNMNGDEQVRQAKVTWTVRATGDALSGEMQREIEGAMMGGGGPSTVTGTRVKS